MSMSDASVDASSGSNPAAEMEAGARAALPADLGSNLDPFMIG